MADERLLSETTGGTSSLPVERDAAFDASLDDEQPPFEIGKCIFPPSEILYRLDPRAYASALAEWRLQQRDRLADTVCNQFPHPIAHCLFRFRNSFESENQRLDFLCDTWEALIAVLYAMVLGEARSLAKSLSDTGIKRDWIQSWTIRERLEIVRLLREANLGLVSAESIPQTAIERMIGLNQRRNEDIRHRGTLNERQARELNAALEVEMLDIFEELLGFSDVSLLRPHEPATGGRFRCETFVGESTTRRFDNVHLDRAILHAHDRYTAEVFMNHSGRLYSLAPMIICRPSATGHRTQLAYFKKKVGAGASRKLVYEVFGDAEPLEETDPVLLQQLDELKALFVTSARNR